MLNVFAQQLFQFQKRMFLDLQPILDEGLTAGQVGEEAARAAQLILDRTNTLLQFVGMISSSDYLSSVRHCCGSSSYWTGTTPSSSSLVWVGAQPEPGRVLFRSVGDPGCFSRIRLFPSRIPYSGSKRYLFRIPDQDQQLRIWVFLTQKLMLSPWICSMIRAVSPDPGSRILILLGMRIASKITNIVGFLTFKRAFVLS